MRPLILLLCLIAGAVLGLGVYTFWYAEGGSYFSNDPRSCANCHIMNDQLESWQKSSHHGFATCNDCHTPHDFLGKWLSKARNGFWHSKGFTLQDFHEPIQISPRNAAALQENCVACHANLTHDIVTLGSAGEPGNNCVRCHASVGHGPTR
ncbi:MAG: cytochrome c nitrite reductase small subunit [Gemmataceae bacterium]